MNNRIDEKIEQYLVNEADYDKMNKKSL